jgi:dihydropteroate synthase
MADFRKLPENDGAAMTINVKGNLINLMERPLVMGILNATPDSFYSSSRAQSDEEIERRVRTIMDEGADIIDLGAYSSRPGADDVTPDEEMRRLAHALEIVNRLYPEAIVSIDTFRGDVARRCVEDYGAAIINDISGGQLDDTMFQAVADLNVPYILMHMIGNPKDMQKHVDYSSMMTQIVNYFVEKIRTLEQMGVKDIIVDPGFGFSKTLDQNYELLGAMDRLQLLNKPILVGVSRKSMIYNLLGTTPDGALNGTTVVNTLSLTLGANILRVHDVKAAVEAVEIYSKFHCYNEKK